MSLLAKKEAPAAAKSADMDKDKDKDSKLADAKKDARDPAVQKATHEESK